ncbi:conserved hypothetical protein [Trichinella spiralis]|uniref:hypothetical protein n=1 Tax=Trichinella spiralis TaxID=6334 RepID=UPI0001EFD705|nr:conserved hypothetical protein [Trichinella spiralis]
MRSASKKRGWKRQIQLVLRHRAALEVAIRKNIAPSGVTCWQLCCNSMNDVNVELMATSKSPSEIWHNLVAVKEQNSGERVDRLMEEFLKCVRSRNGKHGKLTAQTSSPYGLCTLSNNVRVAETRDELLDGVFDGYARRTSSKFG